MSQPSTTAHVGETRILSATAANVADGVPAVFEITTAAGEPIDTLTGAVAGGKARVSWPVDVGDRDLPLELRFRVVAGASEKISRTLRVVPDGAIGDAGWLMPDATPANTTTQTTGAAVPPVADNEIRWLHNPDVKSGTRMRLRVAVASLTGKALFGSFSMQFVFEGATVSNGTLGPFSVLRTVTRSMPASPGGTRAVIASLTTQMFGKQGVLHFRVRVKWNRRPFDTTSAAGLTEALSPTLLVHDPLVIQLAEGPADLVSPAKEATRQWLNTHVAVDYGPGFSAGGTGVDANGVADVTQVSGPQGSASVIQYGSFAMPVHWQPKDATVRANQPNTLELSSRCRLSLWAPTQFIATNALGKARGIIDELTLNHTIFHANPVAGKDLDVRFDPQDPGVPPTPAATPALEIARRRAIYQNVVAQCHAAGIQILAGYAEVTAGSAFVGWIARASDALLAGYARRITEFLFEDPATSLDVDGLSFDLESGALKAGHAGQMKAFYIALAEQFAAHGKYVAFAGGGMVDDTHFFVPPPFRGNPTALGPNLIGNAAAQPFKLAAGQRNILLRPMCYDATIPGGPGGPLLDWHKDIMDYALGDAGLHPSQFQLGIKVTTSPLHSSSIVTRGDIVPKWCPELRKRRIGLQCFAMGPNERWDSEWKAINDALNPDGPAAGTTLGQPLQAPLPKLPP